MNIDKIRELFPIVKQAIYLNNASQAPLNTLVHKRLLENVQTELVPIGKKAFDRNNIRVLLAKILGGKDSEYALQTSTGLGMGIIAQGMHLKKGDNIILPQNEHWNNTFPWLQLEKKGVEVRFVKLDKNNRFTPKDFEDLIDKNTRALVVAAVRFNSGFKPDIKAIGNIAHANNALFVVDAAQAAGMIPINVKNDGIDIMAGCGFKWLLGMHGTGYLYVSEYASQFINPVLPGMFAAKNMFNKLEYHNDARQYETGTIAYSLFDSWTAGLELINEIGVEHIYKKALYNTDIIIEGLQKKGYNIISPIENRDERTAIIHFNTRSLESTKELYHQLIENNILLTLQAENIRVSPNFYTTENEINRFLDLI